MNAPPTFESFLLFDGEKKLVTDIFSFKKDIIDLQSFKGL